MARLTALTKPDAVKKAVAEFRSIGRKEFLAAYGFEESRDYFLRFEGELFDSKPIVAAAFGFEHRHIGPLKPGDFSGGSNGAVRALRRLEFEVVTPAQVNPPKLGKAYTNRTEIYKDFGGNKQAGIVRFPGEDTVNVFSDAAGPYADEPPTLTEQFGYRGEGLNGPHKLTAGGNALLEASRVSRSAVRFWYRPLGESFTFLTWVVVLGRAWVQGLDENKVPRAEIEWRLEAVPGPELSAWPEEITTALSEAASARDDGPEVPEASTGSSYLELLNRVEGRGQPRRRNGVVRTDFARSAAAHMAVLVRSGGRCESPRCTGMPAELNRQGGPILDVDHILDLALGGDDHPSNMVALCPNCHACKTRGAAAKRWRTELANAARKGHELALRQNSMNRGR